MLDGTEDFARATLFATSGLLSLGRRGVCSAEGRVENLLFLCRRFTCGKLRGVVTELGGFAMMKQAACLQRI
jgi:hypothetical protein